MEDSNRYFVIDSKGEKIYINNLFVPGNKEDAIKGTLPIGSKFTVNDAVNAIKEIFGEIRIVDITQED